MALHLVKLCVGVDSVEDLQAFVDARMDAMRAADEKAERYHVTRMIPRRRDELLDGGSLYWVIKGNIQCRSKLLDICPFTDHEGISRCKLVLDTKIILTQWQPRRAFQGWRYLKASEAPADLADNGDGLAALPPELRNELAELGLI
jgi:hypothetical protein